MKKFLIAFLFLLCSTFTRAAVFKSANQPLSFGQAEFTSCTSALRTTAPVYLGLIIETQEDWIIKNVQITPKVSNNSPIAFLTPFQQTTPQLWIYPISAVISDISNPLTFNVAGNVTACQNEFCTTEPIDLNLTLSKDSLYILPTCTGISFALSNTPIPMYMNRLKAWAIRQSDTSAQVTIDFIQKPQTIQIYDSNKTPLTLDIQTDDKRIQFLYPVSSDQENISIFARTHHHYYDIQLPISPKETLLPPPDKFKIFPFLAAILFVLCSSLPIFWVRNTPISQKAFKSQTHLMIFILLFSAFIFLILLQTNPSLDFTFYPLSKWPTLLLMTLGLFLIPANPTVAFLFTLFVPKPYLADLITLNEKMAFLGIATYLSCLLFIPQLIWNTKIFKLLHKTKHTEAIWWAARVPWIILILYFSFYL